MSAFVVHPEHINVLIWAGLRRSSYPLQWIHGNPETSTTLDENNCDEVGHMLLTENVASVDYRYDETSPVPDYTYQRPQHTTWSAAEILNAIHCYQYQSCEHAAWEASQANQFCQALERRIVCDLPGYSDGPWAIATSTTPLLEKRKAAMLARQRS